MTMNGTNTHTKPDRGRRGRFSETELRAKKISEILQVQYGLADARPGARDLPCPKCGKNHFCIHKNDAVGKCFAPDCGFAVTPGGGDSPTERTVEKLTADFLEEFRRGVRPEVKTAQSYLAEKRGFHPQVLNDAEIGVIPVGYDARSAFTPEIENLKKKLSDLHAALDQYDREEIEARKAAGNTRGAGRRGKTPERQKIYDEIAAAERQLDELAKLSGEIVERCGKWGGAITFTYRDASGRITGIQARFTNSKIIAWLYRNGHDAGVFGSLLFRPSGGKWDSKLILCEGAPDALAVQSLVFRATGGYCYCVAFASAADIDTRTIKRLTGAEKPIILPDRDKAGDAALEKLREALAIEVARIPDPFKDIDEYLKSFGTDFAAAFDALKKIISDRKPLLRHFAAVAAEVAEALRRHGKDDGRSEHDRYREAAIIIVKDMIERGRYYHDPVTHIAYFYDATTHIIFEINDGFLATYFFANYEINASEKFAAFLTAHIYDAAFRTGKPIKIHRLFFHDAETNTVYYSDLQAGYFRITAESISHHRNGDADIFFVLPDNCTPWEFIELAPGHESEPLDYFLQGFSFTDSDNLTATEQRMTFKFSLLAMPFGDSIMKTRPIVAFVGPKGSSKTTAARLVVRVFYGPGAEVKSLPDNQKGFVALLYHNFICAIDNADSYRPWLNDQLALTASRHEDETRKYYTNSDTVKILIDNILLLTSRTPQFTREDVADRLLPYPTQRIVNFRGEEEIFAELAEHRNEILSSYLHEIQNALRALAATQGEKFTTKFRMADYAIFALRIARYSGAENEAELRGIFDCMARSQSEFTLSANPVYQLLTDWIQSNENCPVTAGELHEELSRRAAENGGWKYRLNPVKLALFIRNHKSDIQRFYDVREETSRGQKIYSFTRIGGGCGG